MGLCCVYFYIPLLHLVPSLLASDTIAIVKNTKPSYPSLLLLLPYPSLPLIRFVDFLLLSFFFYIFDLQVRE